ncbi:tRNA uracil 4-sulfurtransferase ThiI [Alkalicoccus chagannorensis]|uniref:tRNA uracil 4-sulfurtransferase ThiI n=1 Tax=Alkalicoccus chagannorensis TaxID=427072 RepID=UPI00042086F2|nr:tRNA uracil 4-sulfurtransferase ThiI [Alkalicoccus chagannorensis]
MKADSLLIRYAELSVKGKNRKKFESRLEKNVRKKLAVWPEVTTSRSFGRLYVHLNGAPRLEVESALQDVFGIASFSPVMRTELDEEAVFSAADLMTKEMLPGGGTIKVSVRRIEKQFPVGSQEMNQRIGSAVLRNNPSCTVDVHQPDLELKVEIRTDGIYVSGGQKPGLGGLPVGTSGRGMLLLSGGIDSPVAGYYAMKRGLTLDAVHFHSPPYTNDRALQKVKDLARRLAAYGVGVRLHIVPFTACQLAIHQQVPDNCEITVMRRFMLRMAEAIAAQQDIKALLTGESLGQVASQTIDSMYAINQVTTMPLLRPLITMDKMEVIAQAERIGTYATSILPFEDCCTLFLASDVKTRPNAEKVAYYESFLPIQELVDEAVENAETMYIQAEQPADEADDLL